MTTSVKRKSTLRKLARPEFLILALGVAVCFLGFDSPRQFLKTALFYLNPRYYPDWTRSLLALALIWTILDLGARAAFLNARRKRTRAAAKGDESPELTARRVAFSLEQKWNGISAVLLLAVAITLNAVMSCGYRSVTRLTLLQDSRAVPTLKEYATRGAFAGNANLSEPRFVALGYVCVAVMAFLTLVFTLRWRRVSNRMRAFMLGTSRVLLSRSYLAYATAFVCWDVGIYFLSFLSWALYRYYYLPITNFMYSYKIGWVQLRALALVALAFTSLLAVASIWRDKE